MGTRRPPTITPIVHVNQAGYLPRATKIATISTTARADGTLWFFLNATDGVHEALRLTAPLTYYGEDEASGDYVYLADFSEVESPGLYRLGAFCDGCGNFVPEQRLQRQEFRISSDIYSGLSHAALKYFYYNRTMDIEAEYLSDVVPGNYADSPPIALTNMHARMASRPEGAEDLDTRVLQRGNVPAFLSWTDYKFPAKDYHWDAGDNAIYPENTANFMALLMNMYERYSGYFDNKDQYSLNIPESDDGTPDLLDEIAYDRFTMAGMLPPPDENDSDDNGPFGSTKAKYFGSGVPLVPHKIATWSGYPYVKDRNKDWGAYTPKRDRFCNYVPVDCKVEVCEDEEETSRNILRSKCNTCLNIEEGEYPFPYKTGVDAQNNPVFLWTGREGETLPLAEPSGELAYVALDGEYLSILGDYGCEISRPIYASKPSVTATFGVARYLAQLARLMQKYDEHVAEEYWELAKEADARASANLQSGKPLVWINNAIETLDENGGNTQDYRVQNLKKYFFMNKPPENQQWGDYDTDGYLSEADSLDEGDVDTGDMNTPRGSGPYDDATPEDDEFASAVEMYLTAEVMGDSKARDYADGVLNSKYYDHVDRFDWYNDAGVGLLSMMNGGAPSNLGMESIRSSFVSYARFLKAEVEGQGYPSAIPVILEGIPVNGPYGWYDTVGSDDTDGDGFTPEYPWGSNRDQTLGGIVLVLAYEITGDLSYLKTAYRVMDYLVGTNAMDKSYITGFGRDPYHYVHHRATLFANGTYGAPTPIGWLVGGPMSCPTSCGLKYGWNDLDDYDSEKATPRESPADDFGHEFEPAPPKAKQMAPDTMEAAASGWCSVEVTGDWNAGLAYFAFMLERYSGVLGRQDAPTACGLTVVPLTNNTYSMKIVNKGMKDLRHGWTLNFFIPGDPENRRIQSAIDSTNEAKPMSGQYQVPQAGLAMFEGDEAISGNWGSFEFTMAVTNGGNEEKLEIETATLNGVGCDVNLQD